MGSGGQDDIIAHIRAQFDTQSLKINLEDAKQGFKLLQEAANSALRSDTLKQYAFDMGGLALAVEKLGAAYKTANDTEKALALAANAQEKNFQANVAAQRKAKQDEIDLNDQANQKMIAMNRAYFGQIDQQRKLNQQAANAEEEAEAQAYAKADAAKIQSARQAAQAIVDIQKQQAAQVLASQKSLFSSLQSGASGNISGMLGGVMQQAMAGTLGSAQSGGIGGILGAGGAGLTQSLGLASNLAPVVGGVTLLAEATVSLGSAYIKAYNSSQDFLANLRLIQKEMGTTAQQTSQLTAFMGLTQNPNSPFSVIVFQQVAANLQNLSDIDKGMSEATGMSAGQINKMRDELKKLNVDIYDSKGQVKDITQFTLDLNKAMQGLSPARYAQAGQAIGGLFGKDFMAVVGTAPDQLQKLADSAVVVTQQMLNLAEARKVAYAISTNAEQQFNLQLTGTLTTLDLQIQAQKQLILQRLTMATMQPVQTATWLPGNQNNILGVFLKEAQLDAMTPAQIADEWKKATALSAPEQMAQEQNTKSLKRATDDYKESLKEVGFTIDLGVTSQKNYTTELGNMTTALGNAKTAIGDLKTLNVQGIGAFESGVNGVISSGRGYEGYYKQLKDQQGTVDKLDKLSGQNVQYAYIQDPTTGERTYPTSVKAITAYQKELAKQSTQEDKTQAQVDMVNLRKEQAQAIAATRGKGLTAAQQLSYDQQMGNLVNGTPLSNFNKEQEQAKLDQLAQAAGLQPGQAVTTESIKTGWTKRGLNESEVNQRLGALDQLKQLDFQDKDAQLKTMTASASAFVKAMAEQDPALAQTEIGQRNLKETTDAMAQGLQNFAKSAGLFDSAGFVRSLAEATLQAKLANGEFGKGPDAIKAYYEAFGLLEGKVSDLKDVLSGSDNITAEQAISAGIATPETTTATTALTEAQRMSKYGEGEVTGTITTAAGKEIVNKNLLDRIGKKQVGAAEVADLLTKSQGLDTSKGFLGIYDETIGATSDKAIKLAQTADDEIIKIFSKSYDIKVQIDPTSLDDIGKQIAAYGLLPSPGATEAVHQLDLFNNRWGLGLDTTGFNGDFTGLKGQVKQKNIEVGGANPVIPPAFIGPPASLLNGLGLGTEGAGVAGAGGMGVGATSGATGNDWATTNQGFLDKVRQSIEDAQDLVTKKPLKAKEDVDMSAAAIASREAQLMQARMAMQLVLNANPLYVQLITTGGPTGPTGPTEPAAPSGGSGGSGLGTDPLLPHGAIGGSASAGRPMWIGENGPEVFWPGANGYIIDAIVSRKLMRDSVDRPVYPRQPAIIFNAESPTNNISIDARGSYAPASTVMAVRNATETFMSNDPRVMARMAARRKGQL